MERVHINDLREVMERERRGQSDRAIARDLHVSRVTVRTDREAFAGLDPAGAQQRLAELAVRERRPAQTVSTVAPDQSVVEGLVDRGVELPTIDDRLRAEHGYTGGYASVRRFVARLRPKTPAVTVRVHAGPGAEAQVDCGSAGRLVAPGSQRLRVASVCVMTLSYSRHQDAALVLE